MALNVPRSKDEWVNLFSHINYEDTEMEYECKHDYVTESESRKFTI